ncbi:hypothetical protein QQZ08_010768 [Neonectria magnoliae]|uniref:Uncharacterized protein n=1 Tax=Neonectria magnoliae TaxID=2732573 RepID=A0ABR1HF23_9HYPO
MLYRDSIYVDNAAMSINLSDYNAKFAQQGIRTIFNMLYVRRSMMSRMTMPNGTSTAPGNNIPPLTVKTVELRLPHSVKP